MPFDVFQIDEGWTGQFYDNGWVRPLDDVVPGLKLDPDILTYDGLPFWDKALRTSSTRQGRLMGLPLNGNVDLLVYRKDLYQKLDLKPPRRGTRRSQTAEAPAGRHHEVRYVTRGQPTTGGASVTYEYMPVFYSYGGNWFADEGKDWTPAVNTEAAQAGDGTFRRLLELGPPKPQTVGQADVIALMEGGQALQGHFVAAAAAQLEDPQRSPWSGSSATPSSLPAPTGHAAPDQRHLDACAVPAQQSEPRQKAAADFILWMLERQQQENFVARAASRRGSDVCERSTAGPAVSGGADGFDADGPPLAALRVRMRRCWTRPSRRSARSAPAR